MLKALEYFIVPQNMWPVGIRYAAALRDQVDGIADRIMSHVKADFMKAPPHEYSSQSEVKRYWICKPLEVSGPTAPCQAAPDSKGSRCSCAVGRGNTCPLIFEIPAPLKKMLIAKAKLQGSFLKLSFNYMIEHSTVNHPWAFEVSAPIL